MSLHEAFLRSIIEAPDDDTSRLAYADWLEENGDPDRAEFIRVQCRIAVLDEDEPGRRELQRREYELLADHWGEWAGPLVGRVRRWQFRRGFVEQVKMEAGQFLREAKWLLDLAPIQELRVTSPRLEDLQALLASEHVRRITRLDLSNAHLGDAGMSLLAESSNLAGLTSLSVGGNDIGADGLLALAASPHLKSLRSLDVLGNELPRQAFGSFAAACRLPLESLNWDGEIGPAGIRDLSASPLAGRLKALDLRRAGLGPEGLRLLAESPAFGRLEELSISNDECSASGEAALAGAPLLRRLASLGLIAVALGDEGAAELARAAQAPSLRRLELGNIGQQDWNAMGNNKIGPDGAQALAGSSLCDSLTRLGLCVNPIGDRGAQAVANSPRLGNLRRLDLWTCGITPTGADALLASPHLDRLTCLHLELNQIGRKAFDDLHARLGERLFHHFGYGPGGPEIIRRVKAEPPRCLRGLGPRADTELIRRFPHNLLPREECACVSFELTHADPTQKAVLLGYEDTRGHALFLSPYAVRWQPSGEQREFFDAEQHGRLAELGWNDSPVGSGQRTPWSCGRRGCCDHAFIVTFIYWIRVPWMRYPNLHLPFADQFFFMDLGAYCASQDRVIEIASLRHNRRPARRPHRIDSGRP
jgi:uncharacterized protein (TIGR02996 family)